MSAVAAAAIGGALISSNASQSAGNAQASASLQASQAQQASTAAQLAQQQAQWDQNQKNQMPWITQGQTAGATLADLMGQSGNTNAIGYGDLARNFTSADLNANLAPSYQFMLDQGNQNLNARQAASGMFLTGQGAKDATQYNQDYASNGYQQAYNNYVNNQTNLYNKISGISTTGQNAAAGIGTQGAQVAQAMAGTQQAGTAASNNWTTGAAAANAAGTVGAANAWNSGITNGLQNYQTMNYLNTLGQKAVNPTANATAVPQPPAPNTWTTPSYSLSGGSTPSNAKL